MTLHIEYITDKKGRTKSVVLPRKEWEAFNAAFNKMKNKLDVLIGLKNAMHEVRLIQSGRRKGKTLKEFLDEM
jgi:hypothetical protein